MTAKLLDHILACCCKQQKQDEAWQDNVDVHQSELAWPKALEKQELPIRFADDQAARQFFERSSI